MALYGLTDLSAAQLMAWEDVTASYMEDFYNNDVGGSSADSIRDSTSGVTTEYDVTSLNLSAARRQRKLRLRSIQKQNQRKATTGSAYLFTYSQTIEYINEDDAITVEKILSHPFEGTAKRAEYLAHLKQAHPVLFGGVTSVSAVMVPVPFQSREVSRNSQQVASPALAASNGSSPSTPNTVPSSFSGSLSTSSSDPSPVPGGVYSSNFYCHNSGETCPSGDCPNGDLCMFIPNDIDFTALVH